MDKRHTALFALVFTMVVNVLEATTVWKTSVFDEKYNFLTPYSGLLSICAMFSSMVLFVNFITARRVQFFLGAYFWNSVILFVASFSTTCPGVLESTLCWTSATRILTALIIFFNVEARGDD